MSEELLEIFDKNNQPLNIRLTRKQAHDKNGNFWHHTTAIWITNDENEILAHKIERADLTELIGVWCSTFGGHIQAGENSRTNAMRELKEELGIEVKLEDLQYLCQRKNSLHKHFGDVFVIRWNGKIRDLSFNDGEIKEVKWISPAELEKETAAGRFCNTFINEIKKYLKFNH